MELALLSAHGLHFAVAEDEVHVDLTLRLPSLSLDVRQRAGPPRVLLPLIVGGWDLDFRAQEAFPPGSVPPVYVSRWLVSQQALLVRLCDRRLRALDELACAFLSSPSERPEGSSSPVGYPEEEPDLRVRMYLAEATLSLHHNQQHQQPHHHHHHQSPPPPPPPPLSAGSAGGSELVRLVLRQVDAEYNSWFSAAGDVDSPVIKTGRVRAAAVQLLNSLECAAYHELLSLPHEQGREGMLGAESDGGRAAEAAALVDSPFDEGNDDPLSGGSGGGAQPLATAPLEATYPSGSMHASPTSAPHISVTWHLQASDRVRRLRSLSVRLSPCAISMDVRSTIALRRALMPLRQEATSLGKRGHAVVARWMLFGAYLRGGTFPLARELSPLRIATVSLPALRASVALSARQSGLIVQQIAKALLGDLLIKAGGDDHGFLFYCPPLVLPRAWHQSSAAGAATAAGEPPADGQAVAGSLEDEKGLMHSRSVDRMVRWHYMSHASRFLAKRSMLSSWRLVAMWGALLVIVVGVCLALLLQFASRRAMFASLFEVPEPPPPPPPPPPLASTFTSATAAYPGIRSFVAWWWGA